MLANQQELTRKHFTTLILKPFLPSIKKDAGEKYAAAGSSNTYQAFLRPEGLTPPVGKAPSELKFHRTGHGQLRIDNPTPYHLTLVEMKVGGNKLPDTMVSPHENASLSLPATASGALTYRTINDFGAATSEIRVELK
ncbi:pilus assembly protein [Erwinia sp. E_sp_W01_6]|uniref:fimbrial biogenesis chaperone n=1 Tax=unclassified Erwinia TaxID=2622719 RepID=UPI0030D4358F